MNVVRQDLVATFAKSNGDAHRWTYKDLDPNLPVAKIKEACELLTVLDIFEQEGVKLFDQVVTAKVVTYKEELLFDPEHEPLDPAPKIEPSDEAELNTPSSQEPTPSVCEIPHSFMTNNVPKPATLINTANHQVSLESLTLHSSKALGTNGPSFPPLIDYPETPIQVEKKDGTQKQQPIEKTSPSNNPEGEKSGSVPLKKTKKWKKWFQGLPSRRARNKADPDEFS